MVIFFKHNNDLMQYFWLPLTFRCTVKNMVDNENHPPEQGKADKKLWIDLSEAMPNGFDEDDDEIIELKDEIKTEPEQFEAEAAPDTDLDEADELLDLPPVEKIIDIDALEDDDIDPENVIRLPEDLSFDEDDENEIDILPIEKEPVLKTDDHDDIVEITEFDDILSEDTTEMVTLSEISDTLDVEEDDEDEFLELFDVEEDEEAEPDEAELVEGAARRVGVDLDNTHIICSIQLELGQVLVGGDLPGPGLLVLEQHEVLHHQNVHVGAHEAAVGVLRRADDGLAAHVEGGVDHHRATCALFETAHQPVKPFVSHGINSLNPRRVVDMGDRRHHRADDRVQGGQLASVRGAQFLQPLFEFSGACAGCGETPYVRLLSQLFGPRLLVANATGCSSIYGGNLPTTPYTTNPGGRGPAWNNSLFEDNAEFGLGMRVAIDKQAEHATELLRALSDALGETLVEAIVMAMQHDEAGIAEQRARIKDLKARLLGIDRQEARALESLADYLVRKSVWAIGGDGWAYDIGYGGVDHVLASGRDINILVLDTEVYSNTGGQTSKATPLGAVAKFSAGGKAVLKKDLALMAMAYGNVYVAQVAYGAKDVQVLRAFLEAESYPGPSLIIAYSPCIAHGIDLANNLRQQELAVSAGHWGLFRFDPRKAAEGQNPLHLDSKEPSLPYRDFAMTETRFAMLERTHPEAAHRFMQAAQRQTLSRFHLYEQLARLAVGDTAPE